MPRGKIVTPNIQFYVDEIEIQLRHEEINKGIARVRSQTIPSLIGLGTIVSLVEEESMNTLLTGRISAIRDLKHGKEINEFEIEIKGKEEILDNVYASLSPASLTKQQWINSILGDYPYSKTLNGANMSKTVYFEPPKNYQTRFNLLKDLCSKIDVFFYFDGEGNIVFYEGTIDIVDSTIKLVFEKEKVEDIAPVKNSLSIIGKYVGFVFDEDLEDLSLWNSYQCKWVNRWLVTDGEYRYFDAPSMYFEDTELYTDSSKTISGDYSLMQSITYTCSQGQIEFPYKSGKYYTYYTGFYPRIAFQCSLPTSFNIDDLTYLQIYAAIEFINNENYQCPTDIDVVLLNNTIQINHYAMNGDRYWHWKNSLSLLGGEWNTIVLHRQSFKKSRWEEDYRTITHLEIAFIPDIRPHKVDNQTTVKCWIDGIIIAGKQTIRISIPESINKYGLREIAPVELTENVLDPNLLGKAGTLILERFKPEVSLRRLSTTFDLLRGYAYYIETDKETSLWKVEEITHRISENKWIREYLFSRSPGERGEKTQREIFRKVFYQLGSRGASRVSFASPSLYYFENIIADRIEVRDSAEFWHCVIDMINAKNVNISSLGYLNEMKCDVANIGTIGSLNQLNANIANIGSIASVNYIDANIVNIDEIEYCEYAKFNRVYSIGTIDTIAYANIIQADIQNLGAVENLSAYYLNITNVATINTATINTAYITNIQDLEELNVDKLYVTNIGSINSASIDTANITIIQNVSTLNVSYGTITNLEGANINISGSIIPS